MEKKFKNDTFYVKGPQSLLDALKTELVQIGYKYQENHYKGSLGIYPNLLQGSLVQNLTTEFPINRGYLTLPQDWDKALQLASEEEKFPEYAPKFKAGDFYLFNEKELRYIHKIENGYYCFHQEVPCGADNDSKNSVSYVDKNSEDYRKVSDEEALKMLKEYYAKQGIVEGAKVSCRKWNGTACTIIGFKLKKDTRSGQYSFEEHYASNSQLAILYDNGYGLAYISPDVEGFRVLPKDVMVAGYKAEVFSAGSFKTVKIGCQQYTKDSLITIRDMMETEIKHAKSEGKEVIEDRYYFDHSKTGRLHTSVSEINAAIKLLDNV